MKHLQKLSVVILSIFIITLTSCSNTQKINTTSQKKTLVQKPFFKNDTIATIPNNKKWELIDGLSDEFNNNTFNDNKWHRDAATDGFNWIGRAPGLFEAKNVTVANGNLNVTTVKFKQPKIVKNKEYTHGGAIIRSKKTGNQGMYFECRMKANKTIMSSTFWLAMKQNCNNPDPRKLELDIQECVGRVHEGTKKRAKNWDHIFHSNAIIHKRAQCGTPKSSRGQNKLKLAEKNHENYHVYGFWWKSATDLRFYLDGEYKYSITPTTDFTIEGFITMAIEVYDWNPVDSKGSIFEKGSFDDLTTKYDWVRTWKLAKK